MVSKWGNIMHELGSFTIYKLHNLGDPEFDLSIQLKVKSNGAIRCPLYGSLLMFKK